MTGETDVEYFGEGVIVYCESHRRPHFTGWCSVGNHKKIKLESITLPDAYDECLKKGYKLNEDCTW